MAVTFDSAFEKGFVAAATSVSFVSNAGDVTGSVGSNSNRLLIGIFKASSNSVVSPTMTWNSVSMTQIGSVTETPAGGRVVYLFGLKADANIATGAQTLAATFTGNGDICLGAISVFGADQTTGWQNNTSATGTSTGPSLSITSANGNLVVGGLADNNSSGTATITGGTQDWQERDLNGNYYGSHSASSGASTTLSWTLGTSVAWAFAGVDIIAAAGGGGSPIILPIGIRLERTLKAQKRRRPV